MHISDVAVYKMIVSFTTNIMQIKAVNHLRLQLLSLYSINTIFLTPKAIAGTNQHI